MVARRSTVARGRAALGAFCLAGVFLLLAASWAAARDSRGPSFDTAAELLGPLRLGMPADAALRVAGCKAGLGPESEEGATGDYVRQARLPACGLEFKLAGARKGGAKHVAGITVKAPSRLVTSRGIGIGASEAQVTAAYGRFRDGDGASKPGEVFVAGSIYDGLIFTFKGGRVAEIFLGAAAE